MGIEWFRDLSITIMGFAAAVMSIVLVIVVLRLQRNAKEVLQELKVASVLARDTAEMVHDGVQPVASMLGFFRAMSHGCERSSTQEKKRRM
jgi:tellurite resistance protein TehA-like permease